MDVMPYPTGGGSVDRPASRAAELSGHKLSARLSLVLERLELFSVYGATWRDIAKELDLHHGQASGALSNLHKRAEVFTLHATRDGCHIYVATRYRHWFTDEQVFDSPARTTSSLRRERLEAVATAARSYTNTGSSRDFAALLNQLDILESM